MDILLALRATELAYGQAAETILKARQREDTPRLPEDAGTGGWQKPPAHALTGRDAPEPARGRRFRPAWRWPTPDTEAEVP